MADDTSTFILYVLDKSMLNIIIPKMRTGDAASNKNEYLIA